MEENNNEKCNLISFLTDSLKKLTEKIIKREINVFSIQDDTHFKNLKLIDEVKDYADLSCRRCPNCLDLCSLSQRSRNQRDPTVPPVDHVSVRRSAKFFVQGKP